MPLGTVPLMINSAKEREKKIQTAMECGREGENANGDLKGPGACAHTVQTLL